MEVPTPDQVGSATVWFTTNAGIAATILAFVSISLAIAYVWERVQCRRELKAQNEAWIAQVALLNKTWGDRLDQFRADIKEAFSQNDEIADKVVEAMALVRLEVARQGGRQEGSSHR